MLVELTGMLTLVEGQWYLEGVHVDEVLAEPIPLDVGDEAWLAELAQGDLDADTVVESNLDELTGLLGVEVDLTVEEGTEPAVVHAVNGVPHLLTEE